MAYDKDIGFGNQARDNLLSRKLDKEIKDRADADKKIVDYVKTYAVTNRVDSIIPSYNGAKEINGVKITQHVEDDLGATIKQVYNIPVPNSYIAHVEQLTGDSIEFLVRGFDNSTGKETLTKVVYTPGHSTDDLYNLIKAEIDRAVAADKEHDKQITTLETNLDNEISRAKEAESSLVTKINDETKERKDQDAIIENKIGIEAKRALEAETNLETKINQEIEDRKTGDINEKDRALANENYLHNLVDKEIVRATTVESGIEEDLDDEVVRATNVEREIDSRLSSKIATEIQRATDAESGLGKRIDEIESRSDVTDIVADYTELLAYDVKKLSDRDIIKVLTDNGPYGKGGNSYYRYIASKSQPNCWDLIEAQEAIVTRTVFDAEVNRAKLAESGLQISINNEIIRATSSETNIQANIDAEIIRAKLVESGLRDDINNEVLRAKNVESGLSNDIDAEEIRAITKETNIENNLINEVARATTVESGMFATINQEIKDRESGDIRLENKITTVESGIQNIKAINVESGDLIETIKLGDGKEYKVLTRTTQLINDGEYADTEITETEIQAILGILK